MLCERAGAGRPADAVREPRFDAVEHVAREPQQDRRDAQADVGIEPGIFGGDQCLAEERRNVVVADDQPSLHGEIANQLAVGRIHARNRVGVVVIERGDFWKIAGVGEKHTAQDAEHRGDDKKRDNAGALREANDV